MVELVDTSDLSSDAHCGRVGSSPTSGRNTRLKPPRGVFWVKLIQSIINNVINMERYIKELVEIYTSNTLKSKEELESLKKLIMNAHRAGFIAGEESVVNVIDKLTK